MSILSSSHLARVTAAGKDVLNRLSDSLYPPLCVACGVETDAHRALCKACWPDLAFITGAYCQHCALPLPGQAAAPDLLCDICVSWPRNWGQGRAAVLYEGTGRRIVLGLKHGDRLELAVPMANWMAASGAELLASADLLVPVPLHWSRVIRRKFNQSALLAQRISKLTDRKIIPDALTRIKATPMQRGLSRKERVTMQAAAIALTPRHADQIKGAHVILVDDVLTTGATAAACTQALLDAGAKDVSILVFARVAQGE